MKIDIKPNFKFKFRNKLKGKKNLYVIFGVIFAGFILHRKSSVVWRSGLYKNLSHESYGCCRTYSAHLSHFLSGIHFLLQKYFTEV